jgi:hypothetical protein
MLIMSVLGIMNKKLISFQASHGTPWDNGNKKRRPNLDPPLKSNTQKKLSVNILLLAFQTSCYPWQHH